MMIRLCGTRNGFAFRIRASLKTTEEEVGYYIQRMFAQHARGRLR